MGLRGPARVEVSAFTEATDLEIAWFAGLFEGEGYLGTADISGGYGKRYRMSISMTDEDIILRAAKVTGVGTVTEKKPSTGRWKIQYTWQCSGKTAESLTWKILPYLGQRRMAKFMETLEACRA